MWGGGAMVSFHYADGFALKPHKSILFNVQEKPKNNPKCLLIIMCLILTNCNLKRFVMLSFV